MSNDMSELTNKIMREHESIAAFCEAAGIVNPAEFEQELSEGNLSIEHIEKAAQALNILPEEIGFYFFRPAADPTTEEFYKLYAQLTPENKRKVIAKYYELLAEQEQEKAGQVVYCFDCIDGDIPEGYLTAEEITRKLQGAGAPIMSEQAIKKYAANKEATLYRYTLDSTGTAQNEICIYDAGF